MTPQDDFDRMLDISEEVVAFIQKQVEQVRRSARIAVPAGV